MKTVGLVISMVSTPLAQVQSEHGALLQILSEHVKLSSTVGSTLEKTEELRNHLLAIAEEHKGKKLGKDITEYLKEIKALVITTKDELKTSHEAAVHNIQDLRTKVSDCNDKADSEKVRAASEKAAAAGTKHDECRGKEVAKCAAAIGPTGSCTTFRSSLNTALECKVAPREGVVAEHERRLDIWTNTNNLQSEKDQCDEKLTAYESENKQCQEDQDTYEHDLCHAHMLAWSICGTLDKDHAEAKAAYDQACKDMELPRDTRQSQALVTESIVCMVDKLLADNIVVDQLAACAVKEDPAITDPLNIVCDAADEKEPCSWPDDYYSVPHWKRGAEWFSTNYGSKAWFAKATNSLEDQSRITVKRDCDLESLNSFSDQYDAAKNIPLDQV